MHSLKHIPGFMKRQGWGQRNPLLIFRIFWEERKLPFRPYLLSDGEVILRFCCMYDFPSSQIKPQQPANYYLISPGTPALLHFWRRSNVPLEFFAED